MRKNFFAMSLFAFCSFAMANNVDEKKENQCVVDNQENTVLTSSCDRVWSSTAIYAQNQGFNYLEANCIAMAAYIECIGATGEIDASRDLGMEC